jgi:hypothetical protein
MFWSRFDPGTSGKTRETLGRFSQLARCYQEDELFSQAVFRSVAVRFVLNRKLASSFMFPLQTETRLSL